MSRGVTFLIIGRPTYAYFYANMALSIRRHSPDIKIQAIFEKGLQNYIYPKLHIWDKFTVIDEQDCYVEGRLAPGKAKVNLYKYYEWDETLYLDVDGIALKDITPLFEQERDFVIQKDTMHWAGDDNIINHFGVDKEYIHGSNSSMQFIRKGETAKKIYKEAAKAMENPLPLDKQSNNWFNMQPDELYFGVGMARAKYKNPYFEGWPVYFRTKLAYGAIKPIKEVIKDHYIIGSYGDERYNHKSIRRYYDGQNILNWQNHLQENPPNEYKHFYLMKKKHKKR